MLTLYRFTGATCAAKILLALSEKAIAFEDRVISRDDLTTVWYLRLNPNGLVPTIVHDGEIIVESSVILHYLEDAFGGARLKSDNAVQKARGNHWMKLADDLLSSLGTISYAVYGRNLYLAKSADERETYYASISDWQVRQSRRNAIELGLNAPEAPGAIHALVDLQRRIDTAARIDPFLSGDYGLADISLTPFIFRLSLLGLLLPMEDAPHLHRWWQDVQARPSYLAAITSQVPPESITAVRSAVEIVRPLLDQLLSRKTQIFVR